jgi:hypothetical protein
MTTQGAKTTEVEVLIADRSALANPMTANLDG